ncbi:hypothetical protein VPH35_140221 [Triticum aestivum]|uniref:FBD domain-containing protein n=1 Tax=Aegilops tauschii TaxID=37682 RepID=M8B0Q8_AEGTA
MGVFLLASASDDVGAQRLAARRRAGFLDLPEPADLKDEPLQLSSPSVRYLSITHCNFGRRYEKKRALISIPSLVYLVLAGHSGLVPAFESMPSLLTASIKLDNSSNGWDNNDGSLLLGLLSDTTNLELIAKPKMYAAFMKELKRCTTFSKLKTLSLNDCRVEPDFGPLLYFIQLSPSLQKLHLRLSKKCKHAKETAGSYVPIEPFLASKSFRIVEIKCLAKDELVHKIVKVLSSCGVTDEQININKRIRSFDGLYSDSEQSNYSHSDSEQEQSD